MNPLLDPLLPPASLRQVQQPRPLLRPQLGALHLPLEHRRRPLREVLPRILGLRRHARLQGRVAVVWRVIRVVCVMGEWVSRVRTSCAV